MMIVKLPQSKVETLAEHIEKGLKYFGKAMSCVEEMKEMGGDMNDRYGGGYGYGNRGGNGGYGMRYGGGYGNRWDDDDDDDDMGERRGVPGTGRYSRLRPRYY